MLDFEETIMEYEEFENDELLEAYKKLKGISIEDFENEEGFEDAETRHSAIIHVLEERGLEY